MATAFPVRFADPPGTPRARVAPAPPRRTTVVNDVHSRLNRTRVRSVIRPTTVAQLQEAVRAARDAAAPMSICGGRHSMGGQQFCTGGVLADLSGLNRVVVFDADRGLVTVQAGIEWPELMAHLAWIRGGEDDGWGIVQKQTGANRMSLGGALASNVHGRGLRFRPIVGDVEEFELVDPNGTLVPCSRTVNRDLFRLAIGGYGLFGPIATVTLRLARRHKVRREVEIASIDALPELFASRLQYGYEYGDFQFATDARSRQFLQTGVFATYRPVDSSLPVPEGQRRLTAQDWRRLLLLAHTDRSRAFAEYAAYYLSTDGQVYWSDTHQLAEYEDGYHDHVDRHLASTVRGSEMITELYVPRHRLPSFMADVRRDAIRCGYDIVYGTVRLIERDDETLLAWAREPWACIVFNLHVDHSRAGIARAGAHFRRLIDRAIEHDGSYYLTYHRWATAEQVRAAHPRIDEFLRQKRHYDPGSVFRSDWSVHMAGILEASA